MTFGSNFTITAQFNNGFSGFAVGIPPFVLLPVILVDFSAAKNGTGILVSWQVAQQVNIDGYDVEYSTDGVNFTTIGTVAPNGLDNGTYTFNHLQPVNGNNFYRLKMKNTGGSYRYSAIVKINLAVKAGLVIAPNPVKENFTIQYSNSNTIRQISITDATGRVMKEFAPRSNFGSIVVNAGNYGAGVYFVKMLMQDNSVITQRIVKQ